MTKELKSKLINVAIAEYDNGRYGEASLRYRVIEPIQTEKVDCLYAQLREKLTEEYNNLKQLKKSELNKRFIYRVIYLNVRINDTDQHDTGFEVICNGDVFCNCKSVRCREIKELKPLDEILANINQLQINVRDIPFRIDIPLIGIERNADGTYSRYRYNRIYQKPIECKCRNWPRQKMRNSFCKMVLDKANEFIDVGYKLTSTTYEKFYTVYYFLTFKA